MHRSLVISVVLFSLLGLGTSALAEDNGKELSAQEQYELRAVIYQDMATVNLGSGTVVNTFSVPYKGKYKEPLQGADFYNYVGREDLAEQYTTRRRLAVGLTVGGLAAGLGGMLYAVTSGYNSPPSASDHCLVGRSAQKCAQNNDEFAAELRAYDDEEAASSLRSTVGYTVMGLGFAASLGGLYFTGTAHPVKAHEARRLADEFNKNLRRELGLDDPDGSSTPPPAPAEKPDTEVHVVPMTGHGSAGLAVVGRF